MNDRTWDTAQANYGYGIVAMNSDGHLTINGNGDINNGDELDNSSVDNVVAATGNYKVRIDNATGAGAIADYKDKEIIYVNDITPTQPSLLLTKLTWAHTPIRLNSAVTRCSATDGADRLR